MVTLYIKRVILALLILGAGTVIYANDIDENKYKEVTIQEIKIKNAGVNNVGLSIILSPII